MRSDPIIPEVFVTKYALTKGILRFPNVRHCLDINPDMIAVTNNQTFHGEGRDWHRTFAGAQARAQEMVIAKLKTLDRAAKKVAALTFDTCANAEYVGPDVGNGEWKTLRVGK